MARPFRKTSSEPMSRPSAGQPPLSFVLRLFPGAAVAVRRLYLANDEFRCICEDYALACAGFRRLSTTATPRPDEIADYRSVMDDLERELFTYIARAGDPGTHAASRN
jgi:hypothetical protein